MSNRLLPPSFVSALLAALIGSGIACTSATDAVDHAAASASPADPEGVEPSEGTAPDVDGGAPVGSKDGGTKTAADGGPPATKDAGAKDSGPSTPPSCNGKSFQIAKVVPMPSGYAVAGYHGAYASMVFTTQANPRKLFRHSIADLSNGNLQVLGDDSFYHPEEIISSVAGGFYASLSALRITAVTTTSGAILYRVRSGSDANLSDYTGNLPTLDATSRMTSMYRWKPAGNGKTGLFIVRVGSEVYSKEDIGQTWSLVANLSGSGTSAWQGLALTSEKPSALRFFVKATLAGGQEGIIEQRWPTALASDAEAPVLVFANADATPFGVSDNGCELYASRRNGATLEVVIYRR